MKASRTVRVYRILLISAAAIAVLMGIAIGLALAGTRNAVLILRNLRADPDLPTRILDINDREITQFFQEQKRTLISINDVPKHLIHAFLAREDQNFFTHGGIDPRGIVRALWFNITGQYYSGSSTITMLLAWPLGLTDRTDRSIKRKLKEFWWAVQLERQYTKDEILEMYMNYTDFGGGTQGVEEASQYYFRHGVKDVTLAESAMLVIQPARINYYSPLRYPERASKVQKAVLSEMIRLGYCTKEEADASYAEYWTRYDYTRAGTSTPYFERASLDKARYFSEYIRNYLEDTLFGSANIYRDGLTVHTTLNLDYQEVADSLMKKGIDRLNDRILASTGRATNQYAAYNPLLDILSITFNIDSLQFKEGNAAAKYRKQYVTDINPVIDLISSVFTINGAQSVAIAGYDSELAMVKRTSAQGALICLDSKKGYILAMVGGRDLKSTDEYNRAVNGYVQPGSTFKPLYYSAAIDSRKFTAATMILDQRYAFKSPDGTLYTPQDHKGVSHGRVLLRNALADSMNIPSLKVLDGIGFDAAIQRASRLLGVTDPAEIVNTFPRYYPLGLGVISVSPLQMARAYAVFANQGREVEPIAVRYIEDRNGKIILEPEKEVRAAQARKGDGIQIMPPQTAYIMTSILQSTLKEGTLQGSFSIKDLENRPMAGKTGTTDNWEDIWTVGFSPQIATAIWFGYDEGHNSLGKENTGATFVGPIWADFMEAAHRNLPAEKFVRPQTGLVDVAVDGDSGLLPTQYSKRIITEIFLAGTEPKTFDTLAEKEAKRKQEIEDEIRKTIVQTGLPDDIVGIEIPPLEPNALPSLSPETEVNPLND